MTAWFALTIILAVPAWLAAWTRAPSKVRSLAVVSFLLASPLAGVAIFSALGSPVPLTRFSAPAVGDYDVVGVKMVPGEGIWLLLDDGPIPTYYALPWDAKKASDIQNGINIGEGKVRLRFRDGVASPEAIHPDPQPPAPEKQNTGQGFSYERGD